MRRCSAHTLLVRSVTCVDEAVALSFMCENCSHVNVLFLFSQLLLCCSHPFSV